MKINTRNIIKNIKFNTLFILLFLIIQLEYLKIKIIETTAIMRMNIRIKIKNIKFNSFFILLLCIKKLKYLKFKLIETNTIVRINIRFKMRKIKFKSLFIFWLFIKQLKHLKNRITEIDIKFAFLFVVLLFVTCLEYLTDITLLQLFLKHIDELLVIAFFVYVLWNFKLVFKEKKSLIITWLLMYLLGCISSMVFHYQGGLASGIDAFLLINKFMVGYLTAYIYCAKNNKNLSQKMIVLVRALTVLLFLLAVHDIFMPPFFQKADYRYFIYSLKLMFSHPTYLSSAAVTLLVCLGYTNTNNKNYVYMFMATFVGLMTLRSKAIGFFMIYWLLYMTICVFKCKNYSKLILAGGAACVIVSREQIVTYFFTTSHYSPRAILLKDSIKLALSHFPLGTGFGTFGSSIAAQYYSPLYTSLGYPNNLGMSPDHTTFLSDSFWPAIIAQFGIIGFLIFCIVIWHFYRYSTAKIKVNKLAGFTMLIILLNMLINSIAETSFFNPTSFLLFIIFALCEKEKQLEPV